jgi:predicted GNAT superfamily acetyltransferase
LIDTQHVRERLQRQRDKEESLGQPEGIACLVQVDAEGAPQRNTSLLNSGEKYLSIQIPPDINSLQMDKPEMAVAWRDATRWAFTSAIECGYLVESFYVPADRAVGVYLLTYDKKISDFK